MSNVPNLIDIAECALAELVHDEELVQKNVPSEFSAEEHLHLVVGLIEVLAVDDLTLVSRCLIFFALRN